jgi:nucleoside-diphosphate-sugar epimerase
MHRVVVTGGGGFVGSAIVRELLTGGELVTVVGRSRYPELAAMGVTCLQGDVADQDFMDLACKNADLVYHVAAKAGIWGRWQDYLRTNILGTVACIKSCQKNNVSALVYTSTPSVVFDRHDLEGVDERTPYAKRSLCHYAISKIIAEKLVLQANSEALATTAIRPHLIWGPGDPHLIPRLLDRGRRKKLKIVGNGTNLVDITYIDNVVYAHLLAAKNLFGPGNAAGRAFFIGQEKPVVLWDWINSLLAETGIEQVRRRVPFKTAYFVGGLLELLYCGLKRTVEPPMTRFVALQLARSHWFNHGAAEKVLGYRPEISTREGMQRLLRHCRNGS